MKKHLMLSALILLLSACGWHLRGTNQADLNVDSVYITADRGLSDFVIELKRALAVNQVSTPDLASNADYSIALSNEKKTRRAVSVGNDALVTEYELSLSIDYLITSKQGDLLVPVTKAEVIRSYEFDRNAMVAKSEEENLIKAEMQNTLIQQILRQLRFVSQAEKSSSLTPGEENGQATP